VPWTAFAQVSSQPHLAQPNPLVPPPSVVIVRPNPAPDVAEEARQRAYNAIVGPYRDAQQLRLQQQQYELQQLEIERQRLALQAEKEAYERQQQARRQQSAPDAQKKADQATKTETAKAYQREQEREQPEGVKDKAYWAKLQREAKQRLESSKKPSR
jgi:hypothetical protein